MQRSLLKYRVGLMIIGWLTIFMAVMLLVQVGATKQDAKTQAAANVIADKLDSYVNSKLYVPPSLAAAGIKDVPSTITYTKVNNDIYQLCLTYKKSSNDFSASNLVQELMFGNLSSGNNADQGSYGSSSNPYGIPYISPTYHKGKNCQTVNAGVSAYTSDSSSSSSSTELSTTSTPLASVPSVEQLSRPPARRPPQYLHVCMDSSNTTYVSQGTPTCLPGGNFEFDYDTSVPGTFYSIPCETTTASSATLRYVYISSSESCPSGTITVN